MTGSICVYDGINSEWQVEAYRGRDEARTHYAPTIAQCLRIFVVQVQKLHASHNGINDLWPPPSGERVSGTTPQRLVRQPLLELVGVWECESVNEWQVRHLGIIGKGRHVASREE